VSHIAASQQPTPSVAMAEQPKTNRPATGACTVSGSPNAIPAIGSSTTNGPKTGSRSS
jgi:hypothetical protein